MQIIYNTFSFLCWLLIFSVLFSSLKASAQDTSSGISGKILSRSGLPLQGATVDLVDDSKSTTSDKLGIFTFNIPKGIYNVNVRRIGYTPKTFEVDFTSEKLPELIIDEETTGIGEVIVTATRTEKDAKDIPLPVTIIGKEEMRQKSMVRLNEVLAEQPGVVLDENHGTGIQLQGFDAKYTLILIDGEPVIGRSSGTLELSRITMANVERVEILKGPSSSLYGSEAMAGVVNIITKTPPAGSQMSASTRYGTNNALDLSVDGGIAWKRTSAYAAFNRFSNDGYTFGSESTSNTVPPFYGHTGHVKINHQLTSKLEVTLPIRYNDEHATDRYSTNIGTDDQEVASRFLRTDMAITPNAVYRHSDKHTTSLRLNQSFYRTDTRIRLFADGALYDHDYFNQGFSRAEVQHDYGINDRIRFTAGAGMQYESLTAVRYDQKKEFFAGFGYLQADVRLSERLNFLAGGRFDTHNVYASQFSPKLAGQYKVSPWLTIQGTIGSGFKAPDFRELYLNWTNPTQGYSVFGNEEAAYKLQELADAGQIAEITYDPSRINPLDAERSWNYQAGIKLYPGRSLDGGMSLFSNHVTNLIETIPLAIKTNGKAVSTYSNQEKVIIQGGEAHIGYRWRDLYIRSGFQYLYTANKEVLNAINEGRQYYTRDPRTGSSRLVKPNEYGGLFNRSRYTGNTSITYDWITPGLSLTFRWAYRGRFGVRDIDGNGILNMDEEYAPAYSLFNASAVKSFFNNRFSISLSAENIADVRQTGIATMPGRLFFLGISYRTMQ